MYMCASIVRYMDEPVRNYYNTVMAQKDTEMNLSYQDKYLPGKRIPWSWITEMILNKMCRRTNGNHTTQNTT